jgi:hypothetical protein
MMTSKSACKGKFARERKLKLSMRPLPPTLVSRMHTLCSDRRDENMIGSQSAVPSTANKTSYPPPVRRLLKDNGKGSKHPRDARFPNLCANHKSMMSTLPTTVSRLVEPYSIASLKCEFRGIDNAGLRHLLLSDFLPLVLARNPCY